MIDFNSFFASVEQTLNPALRAKPVAVVPMLADTTCCIAASYEAKKLGIKTGTSVGEAKKRCPDIAFIEASHSKYVAMHHRAVNLVEQHLPVAAVLSIDEMYCELTPRFQPPAAAIKKAKAIKAALLKELGACMTTSVGIAPNVFLAKTASNLVKPNGLVTIDAANILEKIQHLALTDLNGISKGNAARLSRYGIKTVEQLWQLSPAQCKDAWGGVMGLDFWYKLHGHHIPPRRTTTSSISHSHVLPPKDRTIAGAYNTLDRLMQKAGMRLRKQGYMARGMAIYLSCRDAHYQRHLLENTTHLQATQDTQLLLKTMAALFAPLHAQLRHTPKKVGLVLFDLIPADCVNGELFDGFGEVATPTTDTAHTDSHAAVNQAMDKLNARYGKNTVYYATGHLAKDAAPMRIAFNHIPDIATEA